MSKIGDQTGISAGVQETEQGIGVTGMAKITEWDSVYNEDCKITLKRLPDNIIDGIITSPPYNINTERSDCYYNNGYSELDGLSEKDYLEVRTQEFEQFSRVLKDTGTICYNLSYVKENPILPTLLVAKIHGETDLTLADIICWKKSNAIPFQTSPTKLSRITELIYVFVKKRYLHTFKTNKGLSKVNGKTGQKFYRNYVNYIEAKNNDGYGCQLKAAFSQDMVDQLIKIYYPKDSFIYDPFTGIGTTQLSCIKNGCRYTGSELVKEHYEIASKRIAEKQLLCT
jgi:DNA modification methylase